MATKKSSSRTPKKAVYAVAKKQCEQPVVPPQEFTPDVGPERASLIRNVDRKWANGTQLHYHFLTSSASWAGGAAAKRQARDGFKAW